MLITFFTIMSFYISVSSMENNILDTYLTLKKPSQEAIFKEKGSKFLSYAYPISNLDQVEIILQGLKRTSQGKALVLCLANGCCATIL